MKYLYTEITEKILETAYKVHKKLGFGFLEKVYENALRIELTRIGLGVEQQKPLIVWYDNEKIGEFFADLLVEEKIIVEIKAVKQLLDIHEIQILNYLKGSHLQVGLLLNFAESLQVRRKYLKNSERSGQSGAIKQVNQVNQVP